MLLEPYLFKNIALITCLQDLPKFIEELKMEGKLLFFELKLRLLSINLQNVIIVLVNLICFLFQKTILLLKFLNFKMHHFLEFKYMSTFVLWPHEVRVIQETQLFLIQISFFQVLDEWDFIDWKILLLPNFRKVLKHLRLVAEVVSKRCLNIKCPV